MDPEEFDESLIDDAALLDDELEADDDADDEEDLAAHGFHEEGLEPETDF